MPNNPAVGKIKSIHVYTKIHQNIHVVYNTYTMYMYGTCTQQEDVALPDWLHSEKSSPGAKDWA